MVREVTNNSDSNKITFHGEVELAESVETQESGFPFADIPEVVTASPRSATALQRWMPILVRFASVQMAVQVIGFGAGILIVRYLPRREYALYTLGNTMLATILNLSDSGISSAIIAIGGQIWQDDHRLSRLMKTGLQLRRSLALVASPIFIPVLIWLLLRTGASPSRTVLLTAIVLVGGGLELVTRIYSAALRLKSEIRQIQNQALIGAAVKLAAVLVGLLFWFNVEVALFAMFAGYAVQYLMLRGWARRNLDERALGDPKMRSDILVVVKKQSPQTVYWCLQGQITVWLISIFGNADRLAEVGALGRLAVVFAIVGSVASEILFPAFARIRDIRLLRRRYIQMMLAFSAISFGLVGVIAAFPSVFALLGDQYSHLTSEGLLMAVSTVLGAIASLAWGLNSSRAWILPPIKFIVFSILIQIVLVKFLDLSVVRGVILLSILSMFPCVVWAIAFGLLQISKLEAHA
jgi:O-antigen/teichoic acid export membrane protein